MTLGATYNGIGAGDEGGGGSGGGSSSSVDGKQIEQKPVIDQGSGGVSDDSQYVTVKVRSPDGEQVLYRIKKKTRLQKLMNSYCQRTGQNEQSIRFLFEGERLRPEMTADDAGLQEGDLIDAMISQVGGGTRRIREEPDN